MTLACRIIRCFSLNQLEQHVGKKLNRAEIQQALIKLHPSISTFCFCAKKMCPQRRLMQSSITPLVT